MIKAGIVGGTGYTGIELLRLLSQHPQVELAAITSRQEAGKAVQNMNLMFGLPEAMGIDQVSLVP